MEIILKSLTAAIITAVILIIAKFSSPKLAGAIGGIPIVFAISYVLVTLQNRNLSREFLVGGIYGAMAAIFFSLILIWFNQQLPNYHWINFTTLYAMRSCRMSA